jgi:hypothetical protein
MYGDPDKARTCDFPLVEVGDAVCLIRIKWGKHRCIKAICIRVFDLSGAKRIDLEAEIKKKMERNKDRAYKHGGKEY